jgi:hypothetical protein
MLAEEHLCKGKRQWQLARAARSAEHNRMGQLVFLYKPHEVLFNFFLSYDVF